MTPIVATSVDAVPRSCRSTISLTSVSAAPRPPLVGAPALAKTDASRLTQVLLSVADSPELAASRDALLSRLTTREAQVLERIVAGRLNKQIADDLGISIKTVEAHRANIMEKLNANTVADLLKIALGAQSKA